MLKTLVIILSQTRTHELTFTNFKTNVIDVLHADLCLCIGITPNYDYTNDFYQNAKYKFLYDEPDDFGIAFDYAERKIYENDNMGTTNTTISTEPQIHWREFLKIKNQFLGGIKDDKNQHPGSAGILIFFRYFLLENLLNSHVLHEYDRFVITRSDFIYQLPHPKLEFMDEQYIWIPNGQHYGGYSDRHVILSKSNIIPYLNILNNLILRSNDYFAKMANYNEWNLEKLIKFHLEQNYVLHLVKEFPYIMYSVRNLCGNTRWSSGLYSMKLGYYIKYYTEYQQSTQYRDDYCISGLNIDDFYKMRIASIEL